MLLVFSACLPLACGKESSGPATGRLPLAEGQIRRSEYADKLRAMWLGETIANWTGLTTEAVKQDAPFYTDEDWGLDQQLTWKSDPVIGFVFQDPWLSDDDTEVIATCSLSNVIRGALQACNMGYSVGQRWEGQGFVYALARHALEHAFGEMGLHRVMANHMPCNERSARVLQRLGFEREGYARQYLYINGRWEDHVMNALVNPSTQHEEH